MVLGLRERMQMHESGGRDAEFLCGGGRHEDQRACAIRQLGNAGRQIAVSQEAIDRVHRVRRGLDAPAPCVRDQCMDVPRAHQAVAAHPSRDNVGERWSAVLDVADAGRRVGRRCVGIRADDHSDGDLSAGNALAHPRHQRLRRVAAGFGVDHLPRRGGQTLRQCLRKRGGQAAGQTVGRLAQHTQNVDRNLVGDQAGIAPSLCDGIQRQFDRRARAACGAAAAGACDDRREGRR